MRTLHVDGNSTVSITEVPDPVPGPGEVVVETAATALCGSELSTYRGPGKEIGNSGHEAAGIVAELGPGVEELKVGQRVGVSAVAGCGSCEQCARGEYTWCRNWQGYGSMHAESFVAAARACHVLPDDVPWGAGVLISGDGLGVPYHTSTKIRDASIETVAVFGAGPIGLGNVLLQSYLGRQVIAVDILPARLELARKLGAIHALDARDGDPVEQIQNLTGGAGADVCIEAAGRPETAKQCFAAVRTAGTVVFNGEQSAIELSPSEDFIRRDITAVGSWYYHFAEFKEMLELYRQGLPVADLITHRFPFADADTAFQKFAAGETGKALLLYEEKGETSC